MRTESEKLNKILPDLWILVIVLNVIVKSVIKTACMCIIIMQMASVLRPILDEYFPEHMGVRIIAEPGRYYASSAFIVAVNIIGKRTVTSFDSTSSSQGNYVFLTKFNFC